MIPYCIENWVFLLETNKMGIFDYPIKALGSIIGTMSTNFCASLDKMYILNPSSGLNFSWGVI